MNECAVPTLAAPGPTHLHEVDDQKNHAETAQSTRIHLAHSALLQQMLREHDERPDRGHIGLHAIDEISRLEPIGLVHRNVTAVPAMSTDELDDGHLSPCNDLNIRGEIVSTKARRHCAQYPFAPLILHGVGHYDQVDVALWQVKLCVLTSKGVYFCIAPLRRDGFANESYDHLTAFVFLPSGR